MKYTTVWSKIF